MNPLFCWEDKHSRTHSARGGFLPRVTSEAGVAACADYPGVTHKTEMMMFQIDKGIPIPKEMTKYGQYPFHQMEIGDSFFAAGKRTSHIQGSAFRLRPKRFKTKMVEENGVKGVRAWRVE